MTRRHQQPASYGTVGAAQGGVGGTPEELLAKKGLDASGTLVRPPLTLMSLCSASAGRMRSAFSTGGSDGPSPRRCSLTTTVLPHHDGAPSPRRCSRTTIVLPHHDSAPAPRRCSLSHHQSPCRHRGCGLCFCLLGHAAWLAGSTILSLFTAGSTNMSFLSRKESTFKALIQASRGKQCESVKEAANHSLEVSR